MIYVWSRRLWAEGNKGVCRDARLCRDVKAGAGSRGDQAPTLAPTLIRRPMQQQHCQGCCTSGLSSDSVPPVLCQAHVEGVGALHEFVLATGRRARERQAPPRAPLQRERFLDRLGLGLVLGVAEVAARDVLSVRGLEPLAERGERARVQRLVERAHDVGAARGCVVGAGGAEHAREARGERAEVAYVVDRPAPAGVHLAEMRRLADEVRVARVAGAVAPLDGGAVLQEAREGVVLDVLQRPVRPADAVVLRLRDSVRKVRSAREEISDTAWRTCSSPEKKRPTTSLRTKEKRK